MGKKISEDEGRLLLKLARKSIVQEFGNNKNELVSTIPESSQDFLNQKRGVFVTLHQRGELRGCIGIIEPLKSLYEGVIDNAKHAAFHDTRFRPLSFEELQDIKIEVSVLSCPEKLEYKEGRDLISKIRPDLDGVIIRKFFQCDFLAPGLETIETSGRIFRQLCMKAGLPPDEWKTGDLIVSTYQVQFFEED